MSKLQIVRQLAAGIGRGLLAVEVMLVMRWHLMRISHHEKRLDILVARLGDEPEFLNRPKVVEIRSRRAS